MKSLIRPETYRSCCKGNLDISIEKLNSDPPRWAMERFHTEAAGYYSWILALGDHFTNYCLGYTGHRHNSRTERLFSLQRYFLTCKTRCLGDSRFIVLLRADSWRVCWQAHHEKILYVINHWGVWILLGTMRLETDLTRNYVWGWRFDPWPLSVG